MLYLHILVSRESDAILAMEKKWYRKIQNDNLRHNNKPHRRNMYMMCIINFLLLTKAHISSIQSCYVIYSILYVTSILSLLNALLLLRMC